MKKIIKIIAASVLAALSCTSVKAAVVVGPLDYIRISNTLQPNATFYVSSGTVVNLNVTSINPGSIVYRGSNGLMSGDVAATWDDTTDKMTLGDSSSSSNERLYLTGNSDGILSLNRRYNVVTNGQLAGISFYGTPIGFGGASLAGRMGWSFGGITAGQQNSMKIQDSSGNNIAVLGGSRGGVSTNLVGTFNTWLIDGSLGFKMQVASATLDLTTGSEAVMYMVNADASGGSIRLPSLSNSGLDFAATNFRFYRFCRTDLSTNTVNFTSSVSLDTSLSASNSLSTGTCVDIYGNTNTNGAGAVGWSNVTPGLRSTSTISIPPSSGGTGDNLGTHVATKTISAPYGISVSSVVASDYISLLIDHKLYLDGPNSNTWIFKNTETDNVEVEVEGMWVAEFTNAGTSNFWGDAFVSGELDLGNIIYDTNSGASLDLGGVSGYLQFQYGTKTIKVPTLTSGTLEIDSGSQTISGSRVFQSTVTADKIVIPESKDFTIGSDGNWSDEAGKLFRTPLNTAINISSITAFVTGTSTSTLKVRFEERSFSRPLSTGSFVTGWVTISTTPTSFALTQSTMSANSWLFYKSSAPATTAEGGTVYTQEIVVDYKRRYP